MRFRFRKIALTPFLALALVVGAGAQDWPAKPIRFIVSFPPGGVGARRNPPVWMKPGDKVEIEIDKVGILENSIADD
jgi:hypothetical protein